MDFTQIVLKIPFALMFLFPVWAVIFAFFVLFKRRADVDSDGGESTGDVVGAMSTVSGALPGSEFSLERKIDLLRVFAINPLLFAPAGTKVQDVAQRLIIDLAAPVHDHSNAPGHGLDAVEGEKAPGGDQPHVAIQAKVALGVSLAAMIWYFLLQ